MCFLVEKCYFLLKKGHFLVKNREKSSFSNINPLEKHQFLVKIA